MVICGTLDYSYTATRNRKNILELLQTTVTPSEKLLQKKSKMEILLLSDKPRITIPIPVLRTVPEHCVWFTAEGTPPINISIFKDSKLVDSGIGVIVTSFSEEGNYTCAATNEVGTDSREVPVTFGGKCITVACALKDINSILVDLVDIKINRAL